MHLNRIEKPNAKDEMMMEKVLERQDRVFALENPKGEPEKEDRRIPTMGGGKK